MVSEIISQLHSNASPDKANILCRFFKTGPGEYGEGDIFMGITVPQVREVARRNIDTSLNDIETLLRDHVHEIRLCALLILVEQYRRKPQNRQQIVDFYLDHTETINNWDLVDLSAPKIIGQHALNTGNTDILVELSRSETMWRQRIGMVACLTLIKAGITGVPLKIAESLLTHTHPLMHKATGWMLREIGKVDINSLLRFLDTHSATMPRTALRYSIERLPRDLRDHYMRQKKILAMKTK